MKRFFLSMISVTILLTIVTAEANLETVLTLQPPATVQEIHRDANRESISLSGTFGRIELAGFHSALSLWRPSILSSIFDPQEVGYPIFKALASIQRIRGQP
jgi:hypothetical protein